MSDAGGFESASDQERKAWLEFLARHGRLEPIGQAHWSLFTQGGPDLLVTFSRLDDLLDDEPEEMPALHHIAKSQGWSHLALFAKGETWFRDPALWSWFDTQIDRDFFEDFNQTLFYGAEMGGYAACAYSLAAPASRVLAIRPLATLDPSVASWDHRHRQARRHDFRTRFGYAPEMISGQRNVTLLHDPRVTEDAMHAALFRGPMVEHLPCPYLGTAPEVAVESMGLLEALLSAAMKGKADRALWRKLWRKRRNYLPWVRNMALTLSEGENRLREALFMRQAIKRFPEATRFKKRQAEVLEQILAQGKALPKEYDKG